MSKRSSKSSHFRTPGREETDTIEDIDAADATNDGLALGLLIQCVAPSQFQYIENATTAAAAYRALADHHEPKTRLDRLDVSEEFYCMKWNQKQETLPQFLERYEIVLRRLREANSDITSTTSIERLLQMMPRELRHVAHQVTGSLTLTNDFARVRALLETEYKAAIRNGVLSHPRGANNDDRALSAQNNGRREKQPKKGECHWCGKKGHWQTECRAKAAGKPRRNKNYKNHEIKDTVGNHALDHQVWTFSTCVRNEQVTAFSARVGANQVIVDSGASAHMTGDASLLTHLTDCDRSVVVANGAKTQATKMGTMHVKTSLGTTLAMEEVLVVEGMPSTLLSVAAVMKMNPKCQLTFKNDECLIEHEGIPIAKARLDTSNKIYTLELASDSAVHANATTMSISQSELWHQRAGHLPVAAINRCGVLGLGTPDNLPNPTSKCECCVQAKMSKILTPKTHTRSFRSGECWVSDTKGPMRTMSVGGYRYYTVYIDAASLFKIVRFVQSTDASTQLENWAKIMSWSETQTGNKVKVFRSDGGPEFTSTAFEDALEKSGIHHETSTAGNQWQNGIAERAHRSLMEMALAMLAHSGLAKR
ncbi:hypothetical protein AeNC1_017414, partial [Aphanomyces euteiches]